jgi:hypothetical protein
VHDLTAQLLAIRKIILDKETGHPRLIQNLESDAGSPDEETVIVAETEFGGEIFCPSGFQADLRREIVFEPIENIRLRETNRRTTLKVDYERNPCPGHLDHCHLLDDTK